MPEQRSAYRYPPAPVRSNLQIIEPSEQFRKEVKRVLLSILGFIITYLLLVVAGVGLAALSAWGGVWVIMHVKSFFWAAIFGIGLIGLGLMVLYFLLKFVFKSNRTDRTGMIEVKRKDQPMLFDFIERLAKETHTPLPKRVYLSPEANASVFYDSSFWSMFLPVRKNLNIGLGLVNVLNVSEFKAVIAHEFGHFSQKSMKLGSYVYNVNRILYDMLYDNDGYDSTLESWGSLSNVFAFFAELTRVIVTIIQEILQSLYSRINERYLALSREMEFHADAMAASVSGSQSLIGVLNKLEIADVCYRNVISVCEAWVNEGRKSRNLYPQQNIVIGEYARMNSMTIDKCGMLEMGEGSLETRPTSRVVIKDQWASHPSTEERTQHLRKLDIKAPRVSEAAWALFKDSESLQEQITERLYTGVSFEKEPTLVDAETFAAFFAGQTSKYQFDGRYKGFYDDREITVFDARIVAQQECNAGAMSDILTEETLALSKRIIGLSEDIAKLEAVEPKSSGIKTFDFDGDRYEQRDAARINSALQKELADTRQLLEDADKEMFRLYVASASKMGKAEAAVTDYSEMLAMLTKSEAQISKVNSMIREARQLFGQEVTKDLANAVNNNMVRERIAVKQSIKKVLQEEAYESYYTPEEKQTLIKFTEDMRPYFFNVGFDSDAINLYMESLYIYGRIISESTFQRKKKTLHLQLEVIAEAEAVRN